MLYLYAKAIHIIFVICWMAGLFYMVRLFIYHTEARQREEAERRMWEERVTKYEFDAAQFDEKDELEKIIGKGTQIDIPIPQNPITSIFGRLNEKIHSICSRP